VDSPIAANYSETKIKAEYTFSEWLNAVYELGKPKVLSLLLVSTACPMLLASGGRIDFMSIVWTIIGGSLVSSSASVINCIWDMDIDKIMSRTQKRPLVTGILTPTFAAGYALVLGISGVLVLAMLLNPLSAALALFGHLFYVFIYTVWLKRSTPQNIVIGGAAGAIPPLVGWAAVTNSIELPGILMFLLVFLWTPPHFWALALNKNGDYRKANIPMLPVIAGERVTHLQMLMYALAMIPTSILLVLSDSNYSIWSLLIYLMSGFYFAKIIYDLFKLGQQVSTPELTERKTKLCWRIFGFSIVYLIIIFFAMVLDTLVI